MNLVPTHDVIVGFRPEHFLPPNLLFLAQRVAVTAHEGMEPHDLYQFHVTHSEYLGAERILYGFISGGPFNEQKVVSRVPATHSTEINDGSVHSFAIAKRDLKFFDPTTERRTAPRSFGS